MVDILIYNTPEIGVSTIKRKPPTKQHHGYTLKSAKHSLLDPPQKLKCARTACISMLFLKLHFASGNSFRKVKDSLKQHFIRQSQKLINYPFTRSKEHNHIKFMHTVNWRLDIFIQQDILSHMKKNYLNKLK